ncbi:hypothetical protein KKG31_01235 [Patescibacteria group bacterium]|nr:hypothetical protein [Patescibacteria group bacterium]MBU1757803.1 hypothetical protein [Patescibacteria group bacterium]
MKSKKTAPKKQTKKTSQASKKKSIKAVKPSKVARNTTTSPKVLADKLGIFDNMIKRGDRIFLKAPKEFADFPDLLALQKK